MVLLAATEQALNEVYAGHCWNESEAIWLMTVYALTTGYFAAWRRDAPLEPEDVRHWSTARG